LLTTLNDDINNLNVVDFYFWWSVIHTPTLLCIDLLYDKYSKSY